MKMTNDKNDFDAENRLPATASVYPNIFFPILSHRHKPWPKLSDKIDVWLESIGFYRKHVAKDSSSLFRCVSEHVYLSQLSHTTVRRNCIEFVSKNEEIYNTLTTCPLKDYIDRLNNFNEPGNVLDLKIVSLIYKRDFILYTQVEQQPENFTNNGFDKKIVLSLTNDNHFDTVYTKQHITNLAFCQSIVYNLLYKEVFKMEEVDYAVNKMLHDKTARYQKELNAAIFCTGLEMRLEMRESCTNAKDLLDIGITPFPYKVAKSLDPTIFRNVEFDTWNEQRKSTKCGNVIWNNNELKMGSKCYVKIQEDNTVVKHVAYVQEMYPDKGPVVIFDENTGQKVTVPYETLELIPATNSLPISSALKKLIENGFRRHNINGKQQQIDNEEGVVSSTKDVSSTTVKGRSRQQRSQRSMEDVVDYRTRSDHQQLADHQVANDYPYQNTMSIGSDESTLQPDSSSNAVNSQQSFYQNISPYASSPPAFNDGPPQNHQTPNMDPIRQAFPERVGVVPDPHYNYPLEHPPQINTQCSSLPPGYILVPNNNYVQNPDIHIPHAYNASHNVNTAIQHQPQPMYIYTPSQGVYTPMNSFRNVPMDRAPNVVFPVGPSQTAPPFTSPFIVSVYSGNNIPPVQTHHQHPAPVYVAVPPSPVTAAPPQSSPTIYYQLTECDPTCVHLSQHPPPPPSYVNVPQYVEQQQIPVYSSVSHVASAQNNPQVYSGNLPPQEMYPSVIYQPVVQPQQTVPLVNPQPTNRD